MSEQAEAEAVLAFASLFRRRTLMSTGAYMEPPPPSVSATDTEVEAAPVATETTDMDEPAAAEDTKMPILMVSPVRGSASTFNTSQNAMEHADSPSLSLQGGADSRGPSACWPPATPAEVRHTLRRKPLIEPASEKRRLQTYDAHGLGTSLSPRCVCVRRRQEQAAVNGHASPARSGAAAVGESGGGSNTPSPRTRSTPSPGAAAKAWRSDGVRRSSSFSPDASPPAATAAAARALLLMADGGSLCDSGLGVQEPGSEVACSDIMGGDDEHGQVRFQFRAGNRS